MTPPLRSQIQLSAEHWSWLDDTAETRGCTRSEVIAALIDNARDLHRQFDRLTPDPVDGLID